MSCLFLTRDLLFASRVDSVAKQLGVFVRICSDLEAATGIEDPSPVGLVLIDLTHPRLAPEQIVPCLRERLAVSEVPAAFSGSPIAFITGGLLSLAFMGFAGLSVR